MRVDFHTLQLHLHGPTASEWAGKDRWNRYKNIVFWRVAMKKKRDKDSRHLPAQYEAKFMFTFNQFRDGREARAEPAEVLRINPKFSLDHFAKVLPYKDQSVTDNLINACRKAGLK